MKSTKISFAFDFTAVGYTTSAKGTATITTPQATYEADMEYFDETSYGDGYGKGIDICIKRGGEFIRHEIIDLDSFEYRHAYGEELEKWVSRDLALMVEGYERKEGRKS